MFKRITIKKTVLNNFCFLKFVTFLQIVRLMFLFIYNFETFPHLLKSLRDSLLSHDYALDWFTLLTRVFFSFLRDRSDLTHYQSGNGIESSYLIFNTTCDWLTVWMKPFHWIFLFFENRDDIIYLFLYTLLVSFDIYFVFVSHCFVFCMIHKSLMLYTV